MSYALPDRDPRQQLLGVVSVVLIHIVVIYALVNGLGRKVVEVFKKPLEVALIEEVKPEIPPPPPKVVKTQPTPKAPPPPAYVPPPEVPVAAPQSPIAAVSHTPAPPAPPAPAVPVEPARPAVVAVAVACPNHREVQSRVPYPAQAVRQGLSGEVEVEFTVQPNGSIADVTVARSSNKIFNPGVVAAVGQFRCSGQGQAVRVRVPFVFRLEG